MASGTHSADKISFPIVDAVDTSKVSVLQDTVTSINCDEKTVYLEQAGSISYDYLVIALGFRSETFGIPGAMDNALQMVVVKHRKNAIHGLNTSNRNISYETIPSNQRCK